MANILCKVSGIFQKFIFQYFKVFDAELFKIEYIVKHRELLPRPSKTDLSGRFSFTEGLLSAIIKRPS